MCGDTENERLKTEIAQLRQTTVHINSALRTSDRAEQLRAEVDTLRAENERLRRERNEARATIAALQADLQDAWTEGQERDADRDVLPEFGVAE